MTYDEAIQKYGREVVTKFMRIKKFNPGTTIDEVAKSNAPVIEPSVTANQQVAPQDNWMRDSAGNAITAGGNPQKTDTGVLGKDGIVNKTLNFLPDIGVGMAKEAVDLPRQAAELGGSIAEAFSHTDIGKSFGSFLRERFGGMITPDVAQKISEGLQQGMQETDLTKPQTPGEKVGSLATQVGEFFVPGIGQRAAVSKLATAIPKLAEAANTVKSVPYVGKLLTGTTKLASEALGAGGVAALQTGSLEEGAFVGGATAVLSPVLSLATSKFFPAVSRYLQETSLRLTPVQKTNLTGKLEGVLGWLTNKKIIGGAEKRYDTVSAIHEKMENALQSAIKGSDVSVPLEKVTKDIEAVKSLYKDDRDFMAISRQIDSAIETLRLQHPTGEISAESLNIFKRSTYKGAFNKAGDKVSDTVEYDIGDAVYKNLSDALERVKISGQSLRDFNAEYSLAITARKLLKTAIGRKQAGFLAKLLSGLAGSSLGAMFGGPMGAALGTVVAPAAAEAIAGGSARTAGSVLLDAASRAQTGNILKAAPALLPND